MATRAERMVEPRPSSSLVSPQEIPCPHPTVPSPDVAMAGWCPLSPAGAQTTQLLVEPPWMPAVLWDRVTLTCQGSGTASATTWYKDGQRWGQNRRDRFIVTESGTYRCDRSSSGLSQPVAVVNGLLVLQVPALTLLEGDTVTLPCRVMQNRMVTRLQFYRGDEEVSRSSTGTKLSLSPLLLNHSGQYRCRGFVDFGESQEWKDSAPVTVTVHVATGVGVSLLFLVLLVGVAVGWHRWNNKTARKHQERAPPDPPAPPEEGEVLYTHVVSTQQMGGAPTVPRAGGPAAVATAGPDTRRQRPRTRCHSRWGHTATVGARSPGQSRPRQRHGSRDVRQ
ncbi:low affinity immunoglobulin gamma Fc region receptor III-like [Sylvia borin]